MHVLTDRIDETARPEIETDVRRAVIVRLKKDEIAWKRVANDT